MIYFKNMGLKNKIITFFLFLLFLFIFILMFFVLVFPFPDKSNKIIIKDYKKTTSNVVLKFKDKDDFVKYISENNAYDLNYTRSVNFGFRGGALEALSMADTSEARYFEKTSDRYSKTNVRVDGIDEPDIVKTDGKFIYYYRTYFDKSGVNLPEPIIIEERIGIPEIMPGKIMPRKEFINIIDISSLENGKNSVIEDGDRILVNDDRLMVINSAKINSYDLQSKDLETIKKKWNFEAEEGTYIDKVRMAGDDLYVLSKTFITENSPCPIQPLSINKKTFSIPCNSIYYFPDYSYVTYIYSMFVLDVDSGDIKSSMSFVGNPDNFVYYMTKDNIYITYLEKLDLVELFKGFTLETELLSSDIKSKILKVFSYDISDNSKITEYRNILAGYFRAMDKDNRDKAEKDFYNQLNKYITRNKNNIQKSSIVKINTEDLSIKKKGSFPGRLLNEFSIDEYKGYLRIATTIDFNFMFGNVDSESAVYVLNDDLSIVGVVDNLGVTERVYSARFIGDKAYVVTFRQVDPFYIIDLSNPEKPVKKGELKIPGYSSYLHPLDDDLILGVGKEGTVVKLSLFDVSDDYNPVEIDKYFLDSVYWTEILNNHRAFLQNKEKKLFFIPTNKAMYVFSYSDDSLKLVKSVVAKNPKRALYIDDEFYIMTDSLIIVLDKNLNRVKEISLEN